MNTVPYRRIAIPRAIHEAMIRHALDELPNECCGMLAGTLDRENEAAVVTHRYPLMNVFASPTRFRVEPKELLVTHRRMRDEGVELIAVYHSHPSSEPVPSRTDLSEHFHGEVVACVILGMLETPPTVKAWRLTASEGLAIELRAHL
jgi:proteasome lid subunit RPN8/RPN11